MVKITIIYQNGIWKACQYGKVILWSKSQKKLIARIQKYRKEFLACQDIVYIP